MSRGKVPRDSHYSGVVSSELHRLQLLDIQNAISLVREADFRKLQVCTHFPQCRLVAVVDSRSQIAVIASLFEDFCCCFTEAVVDFVIE